MEFLANCLHDLTPLGPGGIEALAAALFLAGLAGGATHCAGMCGPFVVAQVTACSGRMGGDGMLSRLSGAALLPYHLGRMLGYGALGALAGGLAGFASMLSGLRYGLAALLLVAALLMFAQASARLSAFLPQLPKPSLPAVLERRLGGLLVAPTGFRGVALGLMLSALPCGLLYAALAAAASSGSALGGLIGMVSFVAGTVPALVGVALLGRFFGRRNGPLLRVAAIALFALNGTVLAAMAVRILA